MRNLSFAAGIACGLLCGTVAHAQTPCQWAPGMPGSPDCNFAPDHTGLVTTSLPGDILNATDVAVQPDGKPVVSARGYPATDSSQDSFVVIRYLADGSLDDSFGTNGIANVTMTTIGTENADAIAVQNVSVAGGGTEARILVAGSATVSSSGLKAIAVMRLKSDGTLDTTFGSGGRVLLNPKSKQGAAAADLLVDSQGRILLAGTSATTITAVRLTPAGALDTSFGAGGSIHVDFGANAQGWALTVAPDQKIVVAGGVQTKGSKGSTGWDMAVARLTASGALDTSFSSDGKVTVDFGGRLEQAKGVVIDAAGSIVLTGITSLPGSVTTSDIALVRLSSQGAVQSQNTFDIGTWDYVDSLVLDGQGRIVVCGQVATGLMTARFTSTGALDSSYGVGGVSLVDFGGVDAQEAFGSGMAIDSLGRYLIVGYAREAPGLVRVVVTTLNQ